MSKIKLLFDEIDIEDMLATLKSEYSGRIDYDEKKIYISNDNSENSQQETLLHEVIHKKLDNNEQVGTLLHEATHYLDDKAGIEMTEKQIEIIAEVRHKIIVDNKLYK